MKNRFNKHTSNIIIHPYSLVEMLVVIAIIAILIGIGSGGYTVARRWLSQSSTEALLAKIKIAVESYKNDKGYYPLPHTDPTVTTVPNFKLDTNVKDFGDINDAKYDASDTLPAGASIGDIKYEYIPRKNMNNFVDYSKIQQDQSIKVPEGTWSRYYVKDGWNTPAVGETFGAIKYRCPGKINKTSFDLYSVAFA